MPHQSVQILFSGAGSAGHNIHQAVAPFRVAISPVAGGIRLTGDEIAVTLVVEMMRRVAEATKAGHAITEPMFNAVASSTVNDALKHALSFRLNGIHSAVRPMSLSQVAFMNAMLSSDRSLIFGVGPTGTGKTHLAIAAGLNLIAEKRFKSMVVTRPRGMLDGDIMTAALRAETVYDEQLTPIEDALHDLVGRDETRRQIEHGLLEITPLGRMRGRSFNECFILIDEAQNMAKKMMRMALTRLGRNSRMVVTGDPAQIAIAGDEPSGLPHILRHIEGTDIALIHQFQNHQIIRNATVARIEAIYSSEDDPEIRAAA
jgi:phosphate starvation-inducible PhoH-like protein